MIPTDWNPLLCTGDFITGFFDQRSAADMMKESAKMQGFEHPHVLNITGVCVDAGPAPYIIRNLPTLHLRHHLVSQGSSFPS